MATIHGGLDAAELRSLALQPGEVLDFSANINPLGPSRRVSQAAAEADLSAYPDRHSLALREELSARLGVGIDSLIVGNGSTELIHLLARAFLGPSERCLIFAPTFGEYEAAATIAGAEVHLFRADEAQGFRWSVDGAVEAIGQSRPRMVFLCNPNNPTGVYLDAGMSRGCTKPWVQTRCWCWTTPTSPWPTGNGTPSRWSGTATSRSFAR